ncbi:MAG: ABC transporter ATP-binding protein [Lachnospiraceae bacterium]|nr:ABC transporter ATP-binding protein [Lachnospiraceae bacterium]
MEKQSNLSRLLAYAGKHKILTYLSWVLSAGSALIALVPFWYIWRILEEVLEVAPDFGQAEQITYYGWMAVLFAVLSMLIYIGGLMCSHLAAFRIATNIRIRLIHHIATLPLGSIEQFGSGKLRRIIAETSGSAETYLAHQLPDKAKAFATTAGLLILLLVFDWRLGMLSLVPVILGFVIMSKMTGESMQQKITEYQNALADMAGEAVEYVRGIPVVKTFGQTVFSFKRFKKTIEAYEKWAIAYTKELRTPMMFYTLAINSVFVFLIIAGLLFTRNGVENEFLLNLIFYIIITPVISLTLSKIMRQSENEMIVTDALQRIDVVLDMPPLASDAHLKHPKDASVELENVTFGYDDSKNALENLSLKIKTGETVAFVGPSGGGKTTLASLIVRFFDPQEGKVLVGGVDVRNLSKEELMDHVSFVFQNSQLIKASILDNVRLGKPNATEAEVMQALSAAQCMDIIEKFPAGIHTVIGTKGVYLSGGEQQRIAIARAILKNAPIIILDEATAFADPDNESRVQAAFTELAKGRTVIMIAHRLSTVINADRIYVLKEGHLVEQGTCRELIQAEGLFTNMWKDYQRSTQWKVAKEV